MKAEETQIQIVPLDKIIPYEFNNRTHPTEQINRLANSISEFGFNQPLVIDEKNIILVGHGRFAAAKKLGLVEVPVIIKKKLTETQKKAYRILDNKLSSDSVWDLNNLELELTELSENSFNMKDWGLDSLQLMFGDPLSNEDTEKEWEGMPEYIQEDSHAQYSIKVNFYTEQDLNDFGELINQKITTKTRSINFPYIENLDLKSIKVVDE